MKMEAITMNNFKHIEETEIMKEAVEKIERKLLLDNEESNKIKFQAVNQILSELNKVVSKNENK